MTAMGATLHLTILGELSGMLANAESTEDAISNAIQVYTIAGNMAADLAKTKDEAKQLITDIIEETGQVEWANTAGSVRLSAPSIRVSYDAKALDILLRDDIELANRLHVYRKETEVPGTLRITPAKAK